MNRRILTLILLLIPSIAVLPACSSSDSTGTGSGDTGGGDTGGGDTGGGDTGGGDTGGGDTGGDPPTESVSCGGDMSWSTDGSANGTAFAAVSPTGGTGAVFDPETGVLGVGGTAASGGGANSDSMNLSLLNAPTSGTFDVAAAGATYTVNQSGTLTIFTNVTSTFSMTIDEFTADRISGTFSGELQSVDLASTIEITNGAFDFDACN